MLTESQRHGYVPQKQPCRSDSLKLLTFHCIPPVMYQGSSFALSPCGSRDKLLRYVGRDKQLVQISDLQIPKLHPVFPASRWSSRFISSGRTANQAAACLSRQTIYLAGEAGALPIQSPSSKSLAFSIDCQRSTGWFQLEKNFQVT